MVVDKKSSGLSGTGRSTARCCSEAPVAILAAGQSPGHLLSSKRRSQSNQYLRGYGRAGGDLDRGGAEIKAIGNTEKSLPWLRGMPRGENGAQASGAGRSEEGSTGNYCG